MWKEGEKKKKKIDDSFAGLARRAPSRVAQPNHFKGRRCHPSVSHGITGEGDNTWEQKYGQREGAYKSATVQEKVHAIQNQLLLACHSRLATHKKELVYRRMVLKLQPFMQWSFIICLGYTAERQLRPRKLQTSHSQRHSYSSGNTVLPCKNWTS